jgi:DNA processing protein
MVEYSDLCRQMIIALHEVPGVGWHSVKRAVDRQLWKKPRWHIQDLLALGFQAQQANSIAAAYAGKPWAANEAHALALQAADAVALTVIDAAYPARLKEIAQPPWVLYAKGRTELLGRPSVAVVGTRVATAYGRHAAAALAGQLSHEGVTVVSGLAKGIDRCAHEAALHGSGSTIAVLATPIDTCYPQENLLLYRQIAQTGLVLTETPLGTKLHPGQFPLRNRIIAGLAVGTVVVEGAVRSGSLITVEHACHMSREIFAVPGPINSPKSAGPNGLIKRGEAKLVCSAQDIIEELRWLPEEIEASRKRSLDTTITERPEAAELPPEELKLVNLLREQPLSINELHERSAIPFGHLSVLLLNLCIKRKIELQPGSIYTVI